MLFTNFTIPSLESRFMASCTRVRPLKFSFFRMAIMMPVPMAVTPRPPIWISIPRKNCPRGVKVFPASMAISPVTHTALVDVYRESMYLTVTPSWTLQGQNQKNGTDKDHQGKSQSDDPGGRKPLNTSQHDDYLLVYFFCARIPDSPSGRPFCHSSSASIR